MKDKPKPKIVKRVVILSETDWKWLTGWLEELLKTISMDEISADSLRVGGILSDFKAAKREDGTTPNDV